MRMKTILVAGGAGYIGSHMVALLVEKGYDVVVADHLMTGHRQAVKGTEKFYTGDLRDVAFLDRVFCENPIEGVINFAAYSLVGESITDPLKYYGNNIDSCRCVLEAMKRHGVDKIVFSSSAAVYGEPEKQPVEEGDRTDPTNPYGATKLAIEGLLKWCERAYGIHYVALRYFNAAGANPEAGIGEDHDPESHLIPLVLKTALGQRDYIGVYGDDYPTEDGTCVRDYVHVRDLAEAHLLALEHLERTGQSDILNLGSGKGASVREIIDTARRITKKEIPTRMEARRPGDPSTLIASNRRAEAVLGWTPRRGLEEIIADAWVWHSGHPNGYADPSNVN